MSDNEEAPVVQTVAVDDSILLSMKKMLMVADDDHAFDTDLKIHINSVFFALYQLGVGPDTPFSIDDENDTWDEFMTRLDIEAVKSYMFLRLRLLFDPPATATMYDAIDKQTKEFEWRLNSAVDYDEAEVTPDE